MRDAEELLGCHDWPSLEQVVLSHNPVVGANKGELCGQLGTVLEYL